MPPVPYPPLRGTFPSRGRRTIRGYRHLKCSEAATRALNPSYQSLRAAKSQNTHPVCSGFSIGGEAAPSFFTSPTAGARRKALPYREAWLCIEICRRSAAVMGSALPPRPPFPRLRPYVIIYLMKLLFLKRRLLYGKNTYQPRQGFLRHRDRQRAHPPRRRCGLFPHGCA